MKKRRISTNTIPNRLSVIPAVADKSFLDESDFEASRIMIICTVHEHHIIHECTCIHVHVESHKGRASIPFI